MKKRDRVYIIPTYYGFIYGGGIIVCLLAAAIYNNNLAYLLTFFLVALFVIGMHQANSNLKMIFFERAYFELTPAHGRGSGLLYFKSENPAGHIKVFITGKSQRDALAGAIDFIHPKSMVVTRFKLDAHQRGAKRFGRITLFSRYPFGLFYVWKNFTLDTPYFVYPSPRGHQPLPKAWQASAHFRATAPGKGEDFSGHQEYRKGESQKRIDWKAYARGRPLLVKEFAAGDTAQVVLSTALLKGEKEENLQQLAQWVFDCEHKNITYAVIADGQQTAFGSGDRHRGDALRILAGVTD